MSSGPVAGAPPAGNAEEALNVRLGQKGGYAGVEITLAAVDTERLPPEAGRAIQAAITESDFFNLPATSPTTTVGADQLTYEIAVEDGGRRHRVSFVDDGGPVAVRLRPLRDVLLRSST